MNPRRLALVLCAMAELCSAADARGLLETARNEQAQFRRMEAIRLLSRAFSLAPNDPAVLREYAALTPEPRLESALLHRMIRLDATPGLWRDEASARLQIQSRLRDRPVNHLVSSYVPYTVRMKVAPS